MKTFNTGETEKDLRDHYNPEGSDLRKGQLVMLEMLKYIDTVCKKHNIQYRLDSGNVLGAVRHGGFIPWDDDVDIAVSRSDYNKLYKALKQSLHPRYVVQDRFSDPNYPLYFFKLRDKKTHHSSESNKSDKLLLDGFQIDIFRMIKGPIPFLIKIDTAITNRIESPLHMKCRFLWFIVHFLVANMLHPLFRIFSFFFGDKKKIGYDYGVHALQSVKTSTSYPYRPIYYEGIVLMGPNDPISYCQEMYGDAYGDLPAIENRNHHGINKYIFEE